ncbi:extracellular solute-binding protein [Thioflexithrix psekupsensis]|uniref:Fe(3+) ABC transporter substrate-binding protein n=1 Tax=Thioflexithrix psekupsensis TaxID=1570016 RepID=A0A251X6A1_9GAMM|nr:extracellular solute-binding protein [Thioflexithrix psekupsensis]OUD12672.1 Fe(3+) ABC transporter substrate-binding protein [Thioflexithrix psekupsensis]
MFFISSLVVSSLITPTLQADTVVVYTARKDHLIKPLFDAYTKNTGVNIQFTTAQEAALLERLVAEGENTPADMLMTVDAGNLWQATERDILQAIDSPTLTQNIPAHLRDPDQKWFGLSVRARPIVYSTQRVDPKELSTYEDLGDPKWKNRLCLRTSKKVYNQSLTAMMMQRLGAQTTENIIKSWLNNLATDVFASDSQLIEAIEAGQCDLGIVNTYYFGRLQEENPSIPVAIFWPNQADSAGGVHINISGAGITKHAKNPQAAIKLLEWLSTPEAQAMFASLNHEYPANPAVPSSELVRSWGDFKPDTTNLIEAGRLQVEAVKLMDRAGYK